MVPRQGMGGQQAPLPAAAAASCHLLPRCAGAAHSRPWQQSAAQALHELGALPMRLAVGTSGVTPADMLVK